MAVPPRRQQQLSSLLDHPGVFFVFFFILFSPYGGNFAVGLILETNGRKTSTTTPEKGRPHQLDWVRALCVVAAAKREREKLPSSHIGSVVLIETRCGVVNVCYCKLLSLSYSHDLRTRIKAVAWERCPQDKICCSQTPPVAAEDDASCDIIQTPQTFSGISAILLAAIDPPGSLYFTQYASTKHRAATDVSMQ